MASVTTLKEIKDNILSTTLQDDSQIGTMVEDFINLTLHEIENPGWSYSPRREVHHRWSFLKRKTNFDTVATTEEYVLDRDIREIALVRQTTSPAMLERQLDKDFYTARPNPTETGNPLIYRVWELSGVATKLATADTIDIVSSSNSDLNDTDMTVTIWGYSGGILESETLTLNGTTLVPGTVTFDARDIFVSKSKNTAGVITVTAGAITLTTIGKQERNPLHKVLSLYPIPSSAITIYVEGWGHMKELVNDGDSPPFDQSWHYVVRLGALAKTYQHLGKDSDFAMTHGMYAAGVRAMINSDRGTSDHIPRLRRHSPIPLTVGYARRSKDDIA